MSSPLIPQTPTTTLVVTILALLYATLVVLIELAWRFRWPVLSVWLAIGMWRLAR